MSLIACSSNPHFTVLRALFLAVLRIRDVYPGSRIKKAPDPGSRFWIRNTGSGSSKQAFVVDTLLLYTGIAKNRSFPGISGAMICDYSLEGSVRPLSRPRNISWLQGETGPSQQNIFSSFFFGVMRSKLMDTPFCLLKSRSFSRKLSNCILPMHLWCGFGKNLFRIWSSI